MKISANGLKEIRLHEGVKTKAYKDIVGVWTIGVGHTAAAGPPEPKAGMTLTLEEVDEILDRDLDLFEATVNKAVKVPLTQNQFDALVSLAFNIGGGAFAKSTLVKKLNTKDYQGAADQFTVWNKAGNKVVQGLVNRRAKERKLFLTPDKAKAPEKPVKNPTEALKPVEAPKVPEAKENWLVGLLKALRGWLK